MLARSAVQILSRYRYVYENEIYNLVWQHWKHILTCAHIVLLCFWRYELTKDEAEQNLSTALWLLKLAEPRWGDQARMAREKIESVAGAFGEMVPQRYKSCGMLTDRRHRRTGPATTRRAGKYFRRGPFYGRRRYPNRAIRLPLHRGRLCKHLRSYRL